MYLSSNKHPAKIRDVLYQFGLTATSSAFFQMSCAIHLTIDDPTILIYTTKYLYPKVGREFHANWKSVERSLRRITLRAWQNNPALFNRMAQYHYPRCPTASQFIAVVAAYLSSERDHSASAQQMEDEIPAP